MKKRKRANSKNKNKITRDEYTKNKKLYDLVISKKFLFNWYFVTLFSVEQDQNVRFKCSHSCKSCNFNSFNSIHLFSVSFMFLCFYHGSTNPPTTQAQTILQNFFIVWFDFYKVECCVFASIIPWFFYFVFSFSRNCIRLTWYAFWIYIHHLKQMARKYFSI